MKAYAITLSHANDNEDQLLKMIKAHDLLTRRWGMRTPSNPHEETAAMLEAKGNRSLAEFIRGPISPHGI